MVFARSSLNGMGLFEGKPGKNHTPFVAFSRVKPKYKMPEEVALRKYPARFFRTPKMVGGGGAYKAAAFDFGPGHSPGDFSSKDERFVPVNTRPFPGDFPADIRPYSGPGWDFVEPYPSAEGLGQDAAPAKESSWDKLVSTVTAAIPKASEAISKYRKATSSTKSKANQDAPAQAPYIPPPPADNTVLYVSLIGGGVLVVGLTAFLLLRRK